MRNALMLLVVGGLAWSQAITDAAGVIAGGSVGVGAGKKVGEGVAAVLQHAGSTTAKVAKTEPPARVEKPAEKPAEKAADKPKDGAGTVLQVGPGGVVKDHSLVPPPPPIRRAAVVPPPPPPAPPVMPVIQQPIPTLPPPPEVTPDDLKTLAMGTARRDVLKLGTPAARITMFDDGHLVEIYRYQTRETTFGVVRLSDGSVSSVELR
jgi:hypothetical protein